MKTLQNQTLLYDKDCPLCNAYTSGFIKAKLLDGNGRKAYCDINSEDYKFVDLERATNEIALIDTKNNTVIYGIDSIIKVLGNAIPFVEYIGNLKPVKFGLKKLYSLISFNRKVIVPSKEDKSQTPQCVPIFNYKYRTLYILFASLVSSIVLFKYGNIIGHIPESSFFRECVMVLGQIGFQALFISKLAPQKQFTYIGNLMTISLLGSLILIPLLIIHSTVNLPDLTLVAYFGLTLSLMLYEHVRRVKLLEFPSYLSATWILYRMLALIIILNI